MGVRKGYSHARYASALYAAAIAALLSGCSRSDVDVEPAASKAETIRLSESSTADMPEIVVTARREQPKAIG